jgi:hypothetical protein
MSANENTLADLYIIYEYLYMQRVSATGDIMTYHHK